MTQQTGEPAAAEQSAVVRFEGTVPKREPILLGAKEFSAYVWNDRCPRSVRAQVFDAYQDAQDPTSKRFRNQLAQENCTTKVLMAMIPGLGYQEADALQPEEIAELEIKIGLRPDPRKGLTVEDHPPKAETTPTSLKRTGEKSSSGSRRRSA